jgi:hypothetical protein
MVSTRDAHLTCLCGAVQESGSLLAGETFPEETDLCHCNPCRYTSGALYSTTGNLRTAPSAASLAKCAAFASSEHLTRYFCRTCGSQCFILHNAQQRWTAFSGIIEASDSNAQPENIVKITYHGYVDDTVDQILPARLLTLGGEQVPCYHQGDKEAPMSREQVLNPPTTSVQKQDSVEARCQCGSVSFRLKRPNWEGLPANTPYVPPEAHRDKCMASFCCCRSCRLAQGAASLQPWLYLPPENVLASDGTPVRFSVKDGTSLPGILDYHSTPGKNMHSSCATCGATVFYWAEERPHIVNVAVGLLRSPEGSMASNFLWWRWHRFAWMKEQADHHIVAALLEPAS